jgi:1,4-alpha-glucan branching enzyme
MQGAASIQFRGFTSDDQHWLNEGTHYRLFEKLGAHVVEGGTHFGVWAPSARRVSVVGDFNSWDTRATPLHAAGSSGVW